MSNLTDFYLSEEMKTIMVKMAIDCTFPSDLTQLDVSDIMCKAKENLKGNQEYKRLVEMDRLSEYIAYDSHEGSDESLAAIYDKLNELVETSPDDVLDNYFTPCEAFEFDFTIKSILDIIKI